MNKNKKAKSKKKIIFIILTILITIIAFIYTIIEIINIFKKPENLLSEKLIEIIETEDINDYFSKDVDIESEREKYHNKDIVARLEIPNVFNILVTQTTNNNFYLKYNIKKARSSKGTEFVDFRNSLFGKQINVYGHNSKYYDAPFKKLELFKEKEFFDNNEYILLQHSVGRRIYQIVAFKTVTTDYEHMTVDTPNQKEHISKLLENSTYLKDIGYNNDTNILILQTCTTSRSKGYHLLIAFEIE